jgi:hypothetical protein
LPRDGLLCFMTSPLAHRADALSVPGAPYIFSDRSSHNVTASQQDAVLRFWPLLFIANALVWTLASWLYRANLDWAGDMLENYTWGIEWQAGYYKHPPLFAWLTAAWFSVFPRTDLAYFALSSCNAAVGLFGIVALARRFLPAPLAVVAGLAMAVSPVYGSLAIKFNANTVLLSCWPWAAYFFVRYMQTASRGSAAALGALAGICMLGKYFSVVLLATFALAACVVPAWRQRLWHPRILWAVAAGLLVLAPHIGWVVTHDFPTVRYATDRMHESERPAYSIALGLAGYVMPQIAYLLPCMGFAWLLRETRGPGVIALLRGLAKPGRNAGLWWLVGGHFVVVAAVALLTGTALSSQWGRTALFAAMPLWVAVLAAAGLRVSLRRAPRMMLLFWLAALAFSAMGGYVDARRGTRDAREPRVELAHAARAAWRQHVDAPLAIVAGTTKDARAVAFYGHGPVRYWDMLTPSETPWLTGADIARQGALVVCALDDVPCIKAGSAASRSAGERIEVGRHVWGITQPSRAYRVYFLLPAGA